MTKKSADQWFAEYGESHCHPTNKLIHWICVPAIVASLVAMIWDIPVPGALGKIPLLNWATLLIAASFVFYVRLSIPLAIGMLLFNTAIVIGILAYQQAGLGPLWKRK